QQNGRILISYKNLDALEFKIFKLTQNQLEQFNKSYRKEEQRAFIKKLDAHTQWDSKLRNEHDYQNHSTEIAILKLNNGTYVIFASTKNDDETFAFSSIQITNLALVETETETHKIFQVIDRNTGKPVVNADVELSFSENTSRSVQKERFTSNSFGEIHIEKTKDRYRDVNAIVKYGSDIAYFGNYYVSQYYKREKQDTEFKAFLFTDRSIYRPGQTVYFKAIAIKTNPNISTSEVV